MSCWRVRIGQENRDHASTRSRRGIPPAFIRRLDERRRLGLPQLVMASESDQPVHAMARGANAAQDRRGAARGIQQPRRTEFTQAPLVRDMYADRATNDVHATQRRWPE